MWWFIIAIVAFIAFKFILDSNAQSNAVAKQGGMRKKYSVLVDHFLAGNEHCRIVQENSTFIRVGAANPAASTYFDIAQTYGTVTIQWISKSIPLGNHKLEWQFNEFEDQHQMIRKIEHDVEVYMGNVLSKFQ
jgi:hypothetical protein|uniref:hypothetical protein n=1 Tax=Alloprevotella sp. TaxID=1872471 RepID=UPI003FF057EB